MPRKTSPASKTSKTAKPAPKAPRRSHSQFTSVRDAMVMRDSRPYRVGVVTVKGTEYHTVVEKETGKRVKGAPLTSQSSARRALYKLERETGVKFTARQITSAHTKRDKLAAKAAAK